LHETSGPLTCLRAPCSATINRYGFNSLGADAVQDNLTLFAKKAREDPSAKPGGLCSQAPAHDGWMERMW